MDRLTRLGYQAHSRTDLFRRRVQQAQDLLRTHLAETPDTVVAFSGGKDSTVLLHMARQIDPQLPGLYQDEEFTVLPETRRFVAQTPLLHHVAVRQRYEIAPGVEFDHWPPPDPDPPLQVMEPNGVPLGVRLGYRGLLLGLRATESQDRAWHFVRHGPAYQRKSTQLVCNPLHDWTDTDIWAYLAAYAVPYNAVYDRMRAAGIPPERQRVGPFTYLPAIQAGAVDAIRQLWPQTWTAVLQRVPDMKKFESGYTPF